MNKLLRIVLDFYRDVKNLFQSAVSFSWEFELCGIWNLAYNTAIFYYSQIIMKFIVKLFPEIMIKSETVRKRFAKILTSNIRNILQKYDEETAVVRHWDYIEVRSKNEANREELIALLQRIPGIHHFLEVEEKPFTDLHHIFELTLDRKSVV